MNDSELIPQDQAGPPFFLGIDVGGTGIKFGIVDDRGRTVLRERIATEEERGPADACQRMLQTTLAMVGKLGMDFSSIVQVGLATPGTMDLKAGKLLHPHNLPTWWEFPIRDHLREVMKKPVGFQNDANAAAYGEYWVGRGADVNSMVLFTLGTGVGGGIIVDGKLVNGEHSHGSECGHTFIDAGPDARQCGCGRVGHLEAYCSATAVVARTGELLGEGRESSLAKRIDAGEELSSLMVAQEADKGDALSLHVVDETADFLSFGVVNLMHIIDPDAVIFGGAMDFGGNDTELGKRFLHGIREGTAKRAFPGLAEKTLIDFATLGGDAGYIGAAGVARAEYLAAS